MYLASFVNCHFVVCFCWMVAKLISTPQCTLPSHEFSRARIICAFNMWSMCSLFIRSRPQLLHTAAAAAPAHDHLGHVRSQSFMSTMHAISRVQCAMCTEHHTMTFIASNEDKTVLNETTGLTQLFSYIACLDSSSRRRRAWDSTWTWMDRHIAVVKMKKMLCAIHVYCSGPYTMSSNGRRKK